MNKFNGITIPEFKKIAPDYENIDGDQLWNKMEDYVLMRQKYEDVEDSRYLEYVYPVIKFEDVHHDTLNWEILFETNLRIFSRITMFYYIVKYVSRLSYDPRQAYIGHFINRMQHDFTIRCYDEIYNLLHFYLIDDKHITAETRKLPYTFDIYQGSEYHRLKFIKERNEPDFFKDRE